MAELEALYSSLSHEERDELLQAILVAASHGGGAVIKRLEERLFLHAGERLIEELNEEGST